MFTGIIQAIASISSLQKQKDLLRYAINFPLALLDNLDYGASVSIDGVCQTVVAIEGSHVWFEAINETLARTTLNALTVGSQVNLERSAKLGDEIGGHLVSGHIFGTACLIATENNIYTFEWPGQCMKYVFSKGFIAIDGISLTVVDVDKPKGQFTVHLIPETLKRTTLGHKPLGSYVNLEIDAFTQAAVETIENIVAQRHI